MNPVAAWIRTTLSVLVACALPAWMHAQADGSIRRSTKLSGGYVTSSSPALSPDLGTIYVGTIVGNSGRLVALSSTDLSVKWAFTRSAGFEATPLVGPDGTIYAGCLDGNFYALNPEGPDSLRIRWQRKTLGAIGSSAALGPDGTIYVGSDDMNLHAYAADGTPKWQFPTTDRILAPIVVAANGTIYVASTDKMLYALTPAGDLLWPPFATGGALKNAPAIGLDGALFFGSDDQKVYALEPNGTKRWDYFTNGIIDASPAVGADGVVYVPSRDTFFYAFNPTGPDSLRKKWSVRTGLTGSSGPTIRADGTILFGADDNKLHALRSEDGSEGWTFVAAQGDSDFIESSPLVAPDGSIFFGSSDGFFYKLYGSGSPLSGYAAWPTVQRDVMRTGRAVTPTGTNRLVNLSTRAQLAGNATLITGFFVQGGPHAFLARGIGPTLARFGVAGMPDPRLDLFSGSVRLAGNDDWEAQSTAFVSTTTIFSPNTVKETIDAVRAFPLPADSKDAALGTLLETGPYTSQVSSVDGRGGVVLAEIYDVPAGAPSRLMNLSARGQVGIGENALFAGFVVAGQGPTRLLVRAVGPGLAQFGVSGLLRTPTLTLFDGSGKMLRSNTGWLNGGFSYDLVAAAKAVGAFALRPSDPDCAMIVSVPPGAYTLQIAGVGDTTGEALVEIYLLP